MDQTTGRETILEDLLQSVEHHIGHGGKEGSLVDVPRPQPLAEDDLVHGDAAKQPWVTDGVETALDVAFQNPYEETLFETAE